MFSAMGLRKRVKKMDIFAQNSFIRFENEESYGTLSGGIVSLFIITIFICLFLWQTVVTIQKKTITFKYFPLKSNLETGLNMTNFMVGIEGVNLNHQKRYFDIVLQCQQYQKNGTDWIQTTTRTIRLQPCNASQWENYDSTITKQINSYQMNEWVCPPRNLSLLLNGKKQLSIFKFAKISLRKCTNNSEHYPNTTCRTDAQINDFLSEKNMFTFNLNILNPVLSPHLMQFQSYELKTDIYMYFDTKTTTQANLFFDKYSFITDTTVLPWQEQETFQGIIAQDQYKDKQRYPIRNISKSQYLKFYFRKSDIAHNYSQQYQKLDNVYSYIGGLYNIVISIFSFLYLYSQFSFELKIGEKLFTTDQRSSTGSGIVGLLTFFGYLIYKGFKYCGGKSWQRMRKYESWRSEANKQLNIELILQKIATFEFIFRLILQDPLIDLISKKLKPTISEAKLSRKRFEISKQYNGKLQRQATQIHIQNYVKMKRQQQFLKQQFIRPRSSNKKLSEQLLKGRQINDSQNKSEMKLIGYVGERLNKLVQFIRTNSPGTVRQYEYQTPPNIIAIQPFNENQRMINQSNGELLDREKGVHEFRNLTIKQQ